MISDNRLLNEQLCFSIYKASKKFTKMYKLVLNPFNLTYTQYIVLLALFEKDNQTVTSLGQTVNLDSGTLTPLLKKLENKRYIKRVRLPEDERKVYISLTSTAVLLKKDINNKVANCIDLLNFDQTVYNELMDEMNKLTTNLGGIINEENF